MALQTVIMAGGAGTRLRPLTCFRPKPLAPLCGAPVMEYALQLLSRHGISSATATLWYRPQDIVQAFGRGKYGVQLSYVTEDTPLGTAGSVLRAVGKQQETTLVMSGDGLTGVDIGAALRFHRERQADATLVLRHVDIPLSYGVVVTQADGRIERFIEKPDWSRVVSSLVNTGVYLLEKEALSLIPKDAPFDFGRQLFPLMLEKGMALYGYESSEYWCDVGNPEAFLRAQGDLLSGRAGIAPVDSGMRTFPGAVISEDSYVSPDARIAPGAVINGSCVLPGAVIEAGARLQGAIVCSGAVVERGAELDAGTVLGSGASAGAFSRLSGNARIWPQVAVPSGAVVTDAMREPSDIIRVQGGQAACATPVQTAYLAGAFLQATRAQCLAVMHDGQSAAAYHMLLGALAAYGAQRVWALGRGCLGLLGYAVQALHADGALLVQREGITLVDAQGLVLTDKLGAMVETAALQQEMPSPAAQNMAAISTHAPLRAAYLAALAERMKPVRGVKTAILCKNRFLRALLRDALTAAGHSVDAGGEVTLMVSERSARVMTGISAPGEEQQWLLRMRAYSARGDGAYALTDLDVPEGRYLPPDDSPACAAQRRIEQDGIEQALLLLYLFAQERVEDALQALPPLSNRSAEIPCAPADKGRVLEALCAVAQPQAQGGLCARQRDAQAVIRPDPVLPLMHVSACARDAEHAQELCGFFEREIRNLLEDAKTEKQKKKMHGVI